MLEVFLDQFNKLANWEKKICGFVRESQFETVELELELEIEMR